MSKDIEEFTDFLKKDFLGFSCLEKRWSRKICIKEESVAEHSHVVTYLTSLICSYICKEDNYKLYNDCLNYAIFHELDEYVTGDLNHNLKYNTYNGSDLRKEVNELVEVTFEKMLEKDNRHNNLLKNKVLDKKDLPWFVVKTCDWISMIIYSRRELEVGNKTFQGAFDYACYKLKLHCFDFLNFYEKNNYNLDLSVIKQIRDIKWMKKD